MSVSGLSTWPRLASVDDPAGAVGCTWTAPHPARARAAIANATARHGAARLEVS